MEKLNFKITLDAECHDFQKEPPQTIIKLNNVVMATADVTKETSFEFTSECEDVNTLEIQFLNKSMYDVKLDPGGLPYMDKVLDIIKIEIDDIDITNLSYEICEYTPTDEWYTDNHADDPDDFPLPIVGGMSMGWNGTWKITFSTPYYLWLLETM